MIKKKYRRVFSTSTDYVFTSTTGFKSNKTMTKNCELCILQW